MGETNGLGIIWSKGNIYLQQSAPGNKQNMLQKKLLSQHGQQLLGQNLNNNGSVMSSIGKLFWGGPNLLHSVETAPFFANNATLANSLLYPSV